MWALSWMELDKTLFPDSVRKSVTCHYGFSLTGSPREPPLTDEDRLILASSRSAMPMALSLSYAIISDLDLSVGLYALPCSRL